jgi:iron complex transport system ATP-binding protein
VRKLLSLKGVSGGYGEHFKVKNVSLHVKQGEFIGIVGPNGSGKTTLLKLMSRVLPIQSGQIFLMAENIKSLKQKEIAQKVAVLKQHNDLTLPFSVLDVVKMGRYPYQKGIFSSWSEQDNKIVLEAMKRTNILSYKDRNYQSLSGGEKQRVLLARAFAQSPKLLILDEPSNHLDIAHQVDLFQKMHTIVKENNIAVISVIHDLNLASLFCDRILVINHGEIVSDMDPTDSLDVDLLCDVFKVKLIPQSHPNVKRTILTYNPYH